MTDYYFGQGGNNANNGLSFANRKATYANVVSTYSPGGGDTVFACASTAGVRWTCTERIELQSGTNVSSRFTLRGYAGSVIRFDVSTSGSDGALWGSNKHYWSVIAGDGSFEWGDPADWSASNYDGYSAGRQVKLENCSNGEFIGTGVSDGSGSTSNLIIHGARNYFGNSIDADCELIKFYGVDLFLHGTVDTNNEPPGEPGQAGDDWGDMWQLLGSRLLFDTCYFGEGGHNNAEPLGDYLIFQNCDFNGYHRSVTSSTNGHEGMRAFDSSGGNQSNGATTPWGPHLFQNCIYRNTRESDNRDNPATKLETEHCIFRGNYIWACQDRVWQANAISDHGSDGSITRTKIYHNTAYDTGSIGSFISTGSAVANYTDMWEHIDILNNVFDQLGTPVFDRPHFRRYANVENVTDGFADNGWKGARIDGNLVNTAGGGDIECEFRPWSGSFQTFSWENGDLIYPNVFGSGNLKQSPTYQGNPASSPSKAALAPGGGAETGNAVPIATTNGAVVDSNTLTLQDGQAYLFKDDWGMSSLGVEGDYIYLAEIDETRQITSINYTSHQITISGVTVSLSDNSPIYWVKEDGITICRDIGAGQALATIPDPDPDPGVVVPPVTTRLVWVHR